MTKINPYNFYFPTGYFQFHKKQLFNFQLNRPFSKNMPKIIAR